MRFVPSAGLLLIATLTAFLPTVRYPFVYEDTRDAHLTLNPSMMPLQVRAQPFRTVSHVSRAADIWLFGIQPWGFHLSSVLWHVLNVALLLAVAWLVLPPVGALTAAAMFALHPIQVEAVSYVSARGDLLAACGVLLAVLSTSLGSLTGAVVGAVFASLAKETAIVAWGLVFLWAAWTRQATILKGWAVLACVGAVGGAWLVYRWIWAVHLLTVDQTLMGSQLATVWRLLLLIPVPYGFTVDHDWTALAWLGPVALVGSLGLTVWSLTEGWWGRHWFAFGWLWTLVALSPRLFVPAIEGLHERHMVIPMVGWALCAGAWLSNRSAPRI